MGIHQLASVEVGRKSGPMIHRELERRTGGGSLILGTIGSEMSLTGRPPIKTIPGVVAVAEALSVIAVPEQTPARERE